MAEKSISFSSRVIRYFTVVLILVLYFFHGHQKTSSKAICVTHGGAKSNTLTLLYSLPSQHVVDDIWNKQNQPT